MGLSNPILASADFFVGCGSVGIPFAYFMSSVTNEWFDGTSFIPVSIIRGFVECGVSDFRSHLDAFTLMRFGNLWMMKQFMALILFCSSLFWCSYWVYLFQVQWTSMGDTEFESAVQSCNMWYKIFCGSNLYVSIPRSVSQNKMCKKISLAFYVRRWLKQTRELLRVAS